MNVFQLHKIQSNCISITKYKLLLSRPQNSKYSQCILYFVHLHWLPISTRIEYKVLLIVLKAQMGVAPKYLRDVIRLPTSASSLPPLCSLERRELFIPRTRTTMAMFRSFSLLVLLCGIAFHLQLVLLSYHPIFLRPYHFLKLVSFHGAN